MAFTDAINGLNCLVQRGIIRDYAVIGSVAAAMYIEPRFGENIDVIVLVDTDEEYLATFQSIAEEAEGEDGTHYVFGGIPIQFLPFDRDAVIQGHHRERPNGTDWQRKQLKVATAEHLILLYLTARAASETGLRCKAISI